MGSLGQLASKAWFKQPPCSGGRHGKWKYVKQGSENCSRCPDLPCAPGCRRACYVLTNTNAIDRYEASRFLGNYYRQVVEPSQWETIYTSKLSSSFRERTGRSAFEEFSKYSRIDVDNVEPFGVGSNSFSARLSYFSSNGVRYRPETIVFHLTCPYWKVRPLPGVTCSASDISIADALHAKAGLPAA